MVNIYEKRGNKSSEVLNKRQQHVTIIKQVVNIVKNNSKHQQQQLYKSSTKVVTIVKPWKATSKRMVTIIKQVVKSSKNIVNNRQTCVNI
jgi:thioredoxin-like negative regulator of GroEL